MPNLSFGQISPRTYAAVPQATEDDVAAMEEAIRNGAATPEQIAAHRTAVKALRAKAAIAMQEAAQQRALQKSRAVALPPRESMDFRDIDPNAPQLVAEDDLAKRRMLKSRMGIRGSGIMGAYGPTEYGTRFPAMQKRKPAEPIGYHKGTPQMEPVPLNESSPGEHRAIETAKDEAIDAELQKPPGKGQVWRYTPGGPGWGLSDWDESSGDYPGAHESHDYYPAGLPIEQLQERLSRRSFISDEDKQRLRESETSGEGGGGDISGAPKEKPYTVGMHPEDLKKRIAAGQFVSDRDKARIEKYEAHQGRLAASAERDRARHQVVGAENRKREQELAVAARKAQAASLLARRDPQAAARLEETRIQDAGADRRAALASDVQTRREEAADERQAKRDEASTRRAEAMQEGIEKRQSNVARYKAARDVDLAWVQGQKLSSGKLAAMLDIIAKRDTERTSGVPDDQLTPLRPKSTGKLTTTEAAEQGEEAAETVRPIIGIDANTPVTPSKLVTSVLDRAGTDSEIDDEALGEVHRLVQSFKAKGKWQDFDPYTSKSVVAGLLGGERAPTAAEIREAVKKHKAKIKSDYGRSRGRMAGPF